MDRNNSYSSLARDRLAGHHLDLALDRRVYHDGGAGSLRHKLDQLLDIRLFQVDREVLRAERRDAPRQQAQQAASRVFGRVGLKLSLTFRPLSIVLHCAAPLSRLTLIVSACPSAFQFEHRLAGGAHGLVEAHGIGGVIQRYAVDTGYQVTAFKTQLLKLLLFLPGPMR